MGKEDALAQTAWSVGHTFAGETIGTDDCVGPDGVEYPEGPTHARRIVDRVIDSMSEFGWEMVRREGGIS